MKKTELIVLFSLLLLIILVPHSFAVDNETAANATDYYFDVNVAEDGNGTLTSPYNNFTDERIHENSTVHMAGGEYIFEKSRQFNNVSFHGLTAQDTILNGNGTTLTVNGTVNFINITLANFRIVNLGNLNAANAHFTNLLPSHPDGDNSHYYGGAITAFSNKNICLENCSIFNNSAMYGGAIYVSGGNLTVLNSIFYNNTADFFGGAILADSRVRIIINNSHFILNNALDDAGGTIYILNSNLNANNLTIANCSATFGAGITALRSNLTLNNSIFKDNAAKYEGGAIYQIYGSLILNSSEFISNSARNGAGLFINDVNVLNITFNEFINNTASNYAGAIYSLLKKGINFTENIFENNDVYSTSEVNLVIGNGNYTMYVVNQTFNSTIPSSYDGRQLGYVTPVKDQQDGGNCWAFAAIATLESCILKATGEVLDLSEENMKNLMAFYSDYGRSIRDPNWGGDSNMPIAYLVSWLGPVNESEDAYNDKSHLSPVLNSLLHVQNVLFLKRNNYTDNDAIKQAVMNYGAVTANMYYNSKLSWERGGRKICYYYNENASMPTNHEVSIVGWDDSVNVPNAPGRGAWIVRNSWGPNWLGGDSYANHNGYFYVSYYDVAFARPGGYNAYTFILNDTQHFDKNYQYDVSGVTDYFYVSQNTVWFENAFNATDNEFLAGVSTYFNQNTSWDLFIYVNSKLQLVQNGSSIPGYYTINLDCPIPLVKGDVFEILFKITTEGDACFPISEAISLTKYTYYPHVSFVSLNGAKYFDLYDLVHSYPYHSYVTQVACVKGFTQLITLNSTLGNFNITYDSLDLFNITVNLVDENNRTVKNGNVTFEVNGENHTVNVRNGLAFLQIPFVLGLNNISWAFSSPNYYSCSGNATFELLPIKLDMNITVLQDLNNACINFTFSQMINENVTIIINGDNQTVNVANGTYLLRLTQLDYGKYNITAFINNEIYDCENSTDFTVNVKRTHVECFNLTTVYCSGVLYSVRLLDQFNMSVSGREIMFRIGDNVYCNLTDDDGVASVAVSLTDSVYPAIISFEGDELYLKSQNSSTVTVKSSICLPEIVKYTLNSYYVVNLLDEYGNPLNNTSVTLTINKKDYTLLSDGDGNVRFKVPFTSGNFNVNVANPNTGEVLSQSITVLKRITENKDMSFYYGVYPYFKVRVCSDNGGFVSGIKVKLTVNKKSYYLKTNTKGYVSLKINLASGKYTITATYNGFKVSNKITVKPVLITKNMKVKKGKIVKFTAKLLNKNGKVLKGKLIKFKVKGKTYKEKTNKKGIATIKIKNLKVGSYKIVSTYLKLKSTNEIIVRK